MKDTFMKISDEVLNTVYKEKNSEQLILVVSDREATSDAKLQCYEKSGLQWEKVFYEMNAKIGKNGFTKIKKEGDGKTPMGAYSFSIFFGSSEDLGFKFPYRKVNGTQVWVDDAESYFYNTWQEDTSKKLWNSAENLLQPAYKFAAVIDYNNQHIKGMGSAIFFHKINTGATEGCIALCEEELVKVLKWLDPFKKPLIIQGTYDYIRQLQKNSKLI